MISISCQSGFFKFKETIAGDISRFASIYGLDLERERNYWTFSRLLGLPEYSIKGNKFLDVVATKSLSGTQDEIMRANQMVFDFNQNLMVTIDSVTQSAEVDEAGNYFISSGLLLPGSVMDDGSRVTDYAAWFTIDSQRFLYSEVDVD